MELRHLRYFAAIAEAGGVSRAATQLNITQPALSRQIRDLELELGVSLFDRSRGRLVLTGEGEHLLLLGRELLNRADSFREHARALQSGDVGIVRVGVAPLTLECLLPDFLVMFRRKLPGIEVRLSEGSPRDLWTRLKRGELSLAVSFPGHEGLGSRLLFPVCVLALMPQEHRLARRATLDIGELAQERLLLPNRDYLTRQWFDEACRRRHLTPNMLLESAGLHTLAALARAGHGVAIVPSHTPFDHKALHAARVSRDGKTLGAWAAVAWDPDRFQPPSVKHFIEQLAQYAHRAYPGQKHVSRKAVTKE